MLDWIAAIKSQKCDLDHEMFSYGAMNSAFLKHLLKNGQNTFLNVYWHHDMPTVRTIFLKQTNTNAYFILITKLQERFHRLPDDCYESISKFDNITLDRFIFDVNCLMNIVIVSIIIFYNLILQSFYNLYNILQSILQESDH